MGDNSIAAPTSATPTSAATAKHGRDSDIDATVLKRSRIEEADGSEEEEEEEEGENSLEKKARLAEERAIAAERERKSVEERTKLIEKQLAEMQAMVASLRDQMRSVSYAPTSLPPSSLPPSSLPFPIDPALTSSQPGLPNIGAVADPHYSDGQLHKAPIRRASSSVRPADSISMRSFSPTSTSTRQQHSLSANYYGYETTPAHSAITDHMPPPWRNPPAPSSKSSAAIAESDSDSGRTSKGKRPSRSVRRLLSPAQHTVYVALEKTIWEVVLFSLPFMNTQNNSIEIRDHFRGPWLESANSPALRLGSPAPFTSPVMHAVCSILSLSFNPC